MLWRKNTNREETHQKAVECLLKYLLAKKN